MIRSVELRDLSSMANQAVQRQQFQENPSLVKRVDLKMKERIKALVQGILLAFSLFYASGRQACVEAFAQALKGNRFEKLPAQENSLPVQLVSPVRIDSKEFDLSSITNQEDSSSESLLLAAPLIASLSRESSSASSVSEESVDMESPVIEKLDDLFLVRQPGVLSKVPLYVSDEDSEGSVTRSSSSHSFLNEVANKDVSEKPSLARQTCVHEPLDVDNKNEQEKKLEITKQASVVVAASELPLVESTQTNVQNSVGQTAPKKKRFNLGFVDYWNNRNQTKVAVAPSQLVGYSNNVSTQVATGDEKVA